MFKQTLALVVVSTLFFMNSIGVQAVSGDGKSKTITLNGRILEFTYCSKDEQGVYSEISQQLVISVDNGYGSTNNIAISNPLSEEYEALIGKEVVAEGFYSRGNPKSDKRSKNFTIQKVSLVAEDNEANVFPPITFHEKRIAIVGFKFADTTTALPNPQTLRDPVVNYQQNLKAYLADALRGRMTINSDSVDVYGWYTVPYATAGCSTNEVNWENSAKAMASSDANIRLGVNFETYYSHIFFVAPATDCPFAGVASSGMGADSPFQLSAMYPLVSYTSSDYLSLLAHEIGHNFGEWQHPGRSTCFGPAGAGCVRQTTGGSYSPVGINRVIHYSPIEKIIMGAVDISQLQDFGTFGAGSTSVIIHRHEWSSKGFLAATGVIPGTGENVTVMVNSSTRGGYNVTGGSITDVYVLIGSKPPSNSQQLYLVDVTPQTPDNWFDAALKAGSRIQHTTVPFTVINEGFAADNHGRGVRVTFQYTP